LPKLTKLPLSVSPRVLCPFHAFVSTIPPTVSFLLPSSGPGSFSPLCRTRDTTRAAARKTSFFSKMLLPNPFYCLAFPPFDGSCFGEMRKRIPPLGVAVSKTLELANSLKPQIGLRVLRKSSSINPPLLPHPEPGSDLNSLFFPSLNFVLPFFFHLGKPRL